MSENTITATPVNAPDVLRNQPLSRQVDVEIESNILEPVSHNFVSASGGTTRFTLPQKGVLDSKNTTLAFELNGADQTLAYPITVGGAACVERCTLYVGGQVVSRIVNSNVYNFIKNGFRDQAVKTGVLDVRHQTSSELKLRTLPGKIATISALAGGQQALYNPELDQTDDYGLAYNGGVAVAHDIQPSKAIAAIAGQGVEIALRLSDLFPVLEENKLPLLAMAPVEIEIIWARAGNAAIASANIVDCSVIERRLPAQAASTCVVTMVRPRLLVDYIHYDDVEKQKIFDAVNNPNGMALNFKEVVYTNGVNPSATAAATGIQSPVSAIASNHLLGMSMKEVLAIYVVKNWNLTSAQGAIEANNLQPSGNAANDRALIETLRLANTHRNPVTRQFKSQQIIGEKYNWVINNQKVYSRDVDNSAMQHNYLSQCGKMYNVAQAQFDTGNYNMNQMKQLLCSQLINGTTYTDTNAIGVTSRYTSGAMNVIGLNLKKNNSMGLMPGVGTRIGSAPIEFNYQCLKINDNGAGAQGTDTAASFQNIAEIDLGFYIEYRRSLVLRPLGATVSDN